MKKIISIFIVITLLLTAVIFSPISEITAGEIKISYILTTKVDETGELIFPAGDAEDVSIFSDSEGEETLVWDSPLEPDKPLDIDKVFISHDNKNIHVRITLGKKFEDENLDPFISIGIDTDKNPSTGMPKLNEHSYNMGGEDFMARYSTGHGYKKFILDVWDSERGDTIETGGLGNGIAGDKEIKFSIPRRAIRNPSVLDFKVVGRMYQATDPDLSPDHLTYNLQSENPATEISAKILDGKCILTTTPKSIPGTHQYHVKLGESIFSVMHYVVEDKIIENDWNLLYSSNPEMNTRLSIASFQNKIADEKIWFKINFWDELEHMGEYDYKIRVMCDTGAGGNFKDEHFCDETEDFIMEVSTESSRTTSKLYSAKKGMGYNQPRLTDVELDSLAGTVSFSCKLSRIGSPEKIDIKVVAGGWKAPEEYWDNTEEITISQKVDTNPETCDFVISNLKVVEGGGQVKLTWKKPTEGILGFNIYRAEVNGDYSKLNSKPISADKTEYIDKTVTNEIIYNYYVKVVCSGGMEGVKSEIVSAKPHGILEIPTIHVAPIELDLGSRLTPLDHTGKFQIKNEGPGVFVGEIISSTSWLTISPATTSIEAGETEEITVNVTENLIAGKYTGEITISGSGVFKLLPVKLNVPRSSPQTKFVRSLLAEPFTLSIRLKWNPPSYNLEKLLSYKIIRTENYMGKRIDEEMVFEVSADKQFFMDAELTAESRYTYSVSPVYRSGAGVPRMVSSTPVPPLVWISMGIGAEKALVDGEEVKLDVAPFIVSGRTVVPFRFIGEALKAEVSYEAETRTAIFTRGRRVVRIPIGGTTATVDGEEVKVDPPAVIKNGRTLVPLRFVSEAFSAEVEWDGDTRTIDIFYPKGYRPVEWEPKPKEP